MTPTEPVTIPLPGSAALSGLMLAPLHATACYVMAHGAGAGMDHPFMAAVAAGLGERGIATLRYQFPSMQQGSKRPDRPGVAHAAVRAAVEAAARLAPSLPLFAGGKSFGGRMTSQAQAAAVLPGVRGLVFFGFPLHPPKQPSDDRARHLAEVTIPMLFLQGTRDALADLPRMAAVVSQLGPKARLQVVEGADHGFHVPVRSGQTDAQALAAVLDAMTAWIAERFSPA